jgi:hypothetical protein
MWRRIASLLIGISILCLLGYATLYLASNLVRSIAALDQPLVIAIFAASASILAAAITVVGGKIFERKMEIEAHFRQRKFDQYYELLKLLYELTQQTERGTIDENVIKRLTEWQTNLILFGGPKTVRCFVSWFANLKSGKLTLQTIVLMEGFYKALRSDLGISNFGLRHGDLAQLILRHGDLFVLMLQKNPNAPLAELIELEKKMAATGQHDPS